MWHRVNRIACLSNIDAVVLELHRDALFYYAIGYYAERTL